MKSLPSKKVCVADIPEPENFRVKFRYNFFVKNEKTVNARNIAPNTFTNKSNESYTRDLIDSVDFNRFVPRYNEMFWTPQIVGNRHDIVGTISIAENLNTIQYENDFAPTDFSSVLIQDTGKDKKLEFFVKKAYEAIVSSKDQKSTQQEKALRLNAATSEAIDFTFLSDLFNIDSTSSSYLVAKEAPFGGDKQAASSYITSQLRRNKLNLQINNKVIKDLLHSSIFEDNVSPFVDEMRDKLSESEANQALSAGKDNGLFDAGEYDLEIQNYVKQTKIANIQNFDPILQTMGYIIFKEEYDLNQPTTQPILKEVFAIENPEVSTFTDLNVKYAHTYKYTIHSIAYIEIPAIELRNDNVVSVGFFLASKPISEFTNTTEDIPPPHPSDFNIIWDYTQNKPFISWAFPPNPQRDVKKFQVFKRKSLMAPFELIKEYDFDDSEVPDENSEFPDPILVESSLNIKTYFLDTEFTKKDEAIYAVCCVDAHGFSSGYSMQLKIKFNKIMNKLEKTLVSVSGAPKAYPNIYLQVDTFQDTIKDEGHSSLKIYFDPEYLKVRDNEGSDLKLLRVDEDDSYVLQFINVDLQQTQKIKIQLNDSMTTPFLRS